MRARELSAVVGASWMVVGVAACASMSAPAAEKPLPFEELAALCAPDVHPTTLRGVVSTESSWNPYAIGVVGGRLERQPRSLPEAVTAARALERQGFNFSMGLGQVNRYNLAKYGETYETIFEPCRNLKAGSQILKDCYVRARKQMDDEQQALRAAFSCYYSGNFTRGLRPDRAGEPSYAQKVVANSIDLAQAAPVVPAVKPIAGEGVVRVRPTSGSNSRERSPAPQTAGAAAQWVVFADAQGVAKANPDTNPSLATATPSGAPAAASLQDAPEPNPAARVAPPTPKPAAVRPRAAAARESSDAPFVQILN